MIIQVHDAVVDFFDINYRLIYLTVCEYLEL